MKKKEWYELLDRYNEQAEANAYNSIMVDKEQFSEIKKSIKEHIERMKTVAVADAEAKIMDYQRNGYNRAYAESKYNNSRFVKWAKKADVLLESINEDKPLQKKDMQGSFYELRYFGIFTETQMMLICATVLLLFIISRILQ